LKFSVAGGIMPQEMFSSELLENNQHDVCHTDYDSCCGL